MTDSNTKLYLYEDIIELVITTDLPGIYQDNRPMNHRRIKAHKGVTTEIIFHVRDRDRKFQDMSEEVLRAYIIDPMTRRRVLTRQLETLTDIGKLKLTIDAGDIDHINRGTYQIYVVRGEDHISRPLYTDQDNNIVFEIDVTDQIGVDPTPTQVNTQFVQSSDPGSSTDIYVSSALDGNLDRNFTNAQHTLALYLSSFVGNIKIQGSCLLSVPGTEPDDTDWFTIENVLVEDSTITVIPKTFVVNANWIRIVAEAEAGTIEKVVLRN